MKSLARIGALSVGLMAVPLSHAQEVVSAANPTQLATIIQELGYKARLDVDDVGDPIIYSGIGGTEFSIQFYGCDEAANDECRMLLFRVGYDLPSGSNLNAVNSWNEEALVGRAYIDNEDDPWLEWAVNTFGGVTRESFEDTYDWWEVALNNFETEIVD